jgi:hypothetical protein
MGNVRRGEHVQVDNGHNHLMVTNALQCPRSTTRIQASIRRPTTSGKGLRPQRTPLKSPSITSATRGAGLSTNSNVLESKYIDFAMAPSKTAYIFFDHLKRDNPLEDEGRSAALNT